MAGVWNVLPPGAVRVWLMTTRVIDLVAVLSALCFAAIPVIAPFSVDVQVDRHV